MTDEMKGKTVVITGANSGIGFETAVGIASMGAKVVMVCRDEKRGLDALEQVKAKSSNADVELLLADFSSLADVRRLAGQIMAGHAKLDVLVNNAGKIFGTRQVTKEGFEWTLGVNHLAPFLLTNLLLPLLKASAPSRVVTVASMAHMMGKINFDDLMSEKKYEEMPAYAQSKLANVLFASELAKRLEGTGVTSNSLHPGVVATNFAKSGSVFSDIFYKFFGFAMDTPAKGAKTSIYLASSKQVEGVTGKYFAASKQKTPAKQALDAEAAKRLWEISAKLVKL